MSLKKLLILILIIPAINGCSIKNKDIKITGVCHVWKGKSALVAITTSLAKERKPLKIESSDKSKITAMPETLMGSGAITITGLRASDKSGDVFIRVRQNEKIVAEKSFTVLDLEITNITPKYFPVGSRKNKIIYYRMKPADCIPDAQIIQMCQGTNICYTVEPRINSGTIPGTYFAIFKDAVELAPGHYNARLKVHFPDIIPENKENVTSVKESLFDKTCMFVIIIVVFGIFLTIFFLTRNWMIKDDKKRKKSKKKQKLDRKTRKPFKNLKKR